MTTNDTMGGERKVDVLAAMDDVWHRGLCSENVLSFEEARSAVSKLIEDHKIMREALQWVSGYSYAGGRSFGEVSPVKEALASIGATP
jgi:hypothetical protein